MSRHPLQPTTGRIGHGAFVPQGWKLEYSGWSATDAWARSVELAGRLDRRLQILGVGLLDVTVCEVIPDVDHPDLPVAGKARCPGVIRIADGENCPKAPDVLDRLLHGLAGGRLDQ